jgi:hypothetical protein
MVASSNNLADLAFVSTTSSAITTSSSSAFADSETRFFPIRRSGSIGGNLKDIVLETVSAVTPAYASASATASSASSSACNNSKRPARTVTPTTTAGTAATAATGTTGPVTSERTQRPRPPRRQKMASIGVEAMRMMPDSCSSPSSTGTDTGTDTRNTMRAIPLTPVPLLHPITSIAIALNQEQRKSHFQHKLFQKTCHPHHNDVMKNMNYNMLSIQLISTAPMMPDISTKVNENITTTKAQKKQEEHDRDVHKRRLLLELSSGEGDGVTESTHPCTTWSTISSSSDSSSSNSSSLNLLHKNAFDDDDDDDSHEEVTTTIATTATSLSPRVTAFSDADSNDNNKDTSTPLPPQPHQKQQSLSTVIASEDDLDWGTFISFSEDEDFDHECDCSSSSPSLNSIFHHPGFLGAVHHQQPNHWME